VELELVDEAARARQPEPEPVAGRVAVLQRQVHVGDPRPLVAGHDLDALAAAQVHDAQRDLAGARVGGDVAGYLGDRGGEQREIRAGEPEVGAHRARLLARADDVGVGFDRNPDASRHRRPAPP
jgi:hypothetical protein